MWLEQPCFAVDITLSHKTMSPRSGRLRLQPQMPLHGLDKFGLGVLLYAYAVLLGAAYLFSFWRTFGFDIFPYLSLQNYVSAPLNRVIVLVAVPLVMAAIVFGRSGVTSESTARIISLYLLVLYCLWFVICQFLAISRYKQYEFYFDNELNVLAIATILFLAALVVTYRIFKSSSPMQLKVFALILVQTAVSMSAGYSDGKVIYNGAVQVYYLGNKELCDPGGVQDWVYLNKFGEQAFFLNTIDKRLCITSEKDYKLVSRKFKEGM
jgi:hypothetical protein